jgi:hypothetical protein
LCVRGLFHGGFDARPIRHSGTMPRRAVPLPCPT